MFQRPGKSSRPPAPPAADAGDATGRRLQMLLQWRDDAKRVGRAYTAWCAADPRDRGRRYLSFLEALTREEQAAHQLERVISAAGTTAPAAR
jgi:heme oxygenase